jgi:hypothetical protein
MGDEMKFPDKIWAHETTNTYSINDNSALWHCVKYIRADLVPISCGGTMSEHDSNALARAEITEWPGRKI